MKDITLLGRGDDWTECTFRTKELWGTSTCLLIPVLGDKPFTKVFAFDGEEIVIDGVPRKNEALIRAIQFAKTLKIPVVGQLPYSDEIYPLRDIAREFKWGLLRNTFSYMLAYAIYLKYERIYIYGIGGRIRADYEAGRMYILSWHGIALGRGIEVIIGRGSARWLFKNDIIYPDRNLIESWHNERTVLPC